MNPSDPIRSILNLARWAPSGDNTQPWEFEIVNPLHVVVHGRDTRNTPCVYDLDGHPSQISLGALIETASIAASDAGLRVTAPLRKGMPEDRPTFDLHFQPDPAVKRDDLVAFIEQRRVQRRPLSTRTLSALEKQRLQSVLPVGYRLHWIEDLSQRLRAAVLMFRSAHLRLTIPEAYEVHRSIIEWGKKTSTTMVPDQALGIDAFTTATMRFVMKDWARVRFFNRYLAGTWAPRLMMDLLPGIRCGAHFVLCADRAATTTEDYVAAGRAVQRFWLQATALGLQMQPEVTPLVFSRYAREERKFSDEAHAIPAATDIQERFEHLVGSRTAADAVFMGRIGAGAPAIARSERKSLDELMRQADSKSAD